MFKESLLKGKRILVTGGGSGLGKEMASEYADLGAEVYICGRRQSVPVSYTHLRAHET